MGWPPGRPYSIVVLPSSSSSPFTLGGRPLPLPLPGPLSLGPDPALGEREVAGVFRFWRPGRPDGEMELVVERPEPNGERDAALPWLSMVLKVEGGALAVRGLLGSRLGGPSDVEGPWRWPRGSSPQVGDRMVSSRPSRWVTEVSGC